MARGDSDTGERARTVNTGARFVKWAIVSPDGGDPHTLTSLGAATVSFHPDVPQPLRNIHHGIALFNHDRQLMRGLGHSTV